MSRNEDDDEKRLFLCARKYEIIVKQFDQLVEMMEARTRPTKRRRSTRGGSSSSGPASTNQADNDEVFVQTISRFLDELRSNPTEDTGNLKSSTGSG